MTVKETVTPHITPQSVELMDIPIDLNVKCNVHQESINKVMVNAHMVLTVHTVLTNIYLFVLFLDKHIIIDAH